MPTNDPELNNPYASPQAEDAQATPAAGGLSFFVMIASVLLFAVSLTQDGYYIARDGFDKADPAWGLLLIGWLGMGETLAWFANPMLLAAWLLTWRKQGIPAIVAASLALVLSLSFLLTDKILCDEAGNRSPIIGYGYGYWLWIASIVVAFVAAVATFSERPPKLTDDRHWWAEHRRKYAKK
jgi:UDP-N-acetylmuramyl pentapeptide phosphotransferase/UDP-N-acetylglucosamine-1-phosphate transferase